MTIHAWPASSSSDHSISSSPSPSSSSPSSSSSSLQGAPALNSTNVMQQQSPWEETSSGKGFDDEARISSLLSPASVAATTGTSDAPNTAALGGDLLDDQLNVLERTLEQSSDDLDDFHATVVPLAEALLNIGEKTGSKEKIMRAHAVLSESAAMGVWALDALDEYTKNH